MFGKASWRLSTWKHSRRPSQRTRRPRHRKRQFAPPDSHGEDCKAQSDTRDTSGASTPQQPSLLKRLRRSQAPVASAQSFPMSSWHPKLRQQWSEAQHLPIDTWQRGLQQFLDSRSATSHQKSAAHIKATLADALNIKQALALESDAGLSTSKQTLATLLGAALTYAPMAHKHTIHDDSLLSALLGRILSLTPLAPQTCGVQTSPRKASPSPLAARSAPTLPDPIAEDQSPSTLPARLESTSHAPLDALHDSVFLRKLSPSWMTAFASGDKFVEFVSYKTAHSGNHMKSLEPNSVVVFGPTGNPQTIDAISVTKAKPVTAQHMSTANEACLLVPHSLREALYH